MKNEVNAINLENQIIKNEIENNKKLAEKIYNKFEKQKLIKRSSVKAFSFIVTGLNFIYKKPFTQSELEKIITDGSDDGNIDAIVFSKDSIDIFDFSSENPESSQMIILQKSIDDNIINKPKDFSIFNERLKKILKKVHLKSNVVKKKRLFVVRDSEWVTGRNAMDDLKKKVESIKGGEFIYLNKNKLVQKIKESEKYLPEHLLPIDANEKINYISKDNKEAFLRIPIIHLLNLKKKSDEENCDIFNKNIRIYLKNKGLSKQLKDTLNNKPEYFSIYHNGILITTTDDIELVSGHVNIKKPQIVNGAQTINSLYQNFKDDLTNKNLKKAKIICKIIVADKILTNKVCETSNTQIPIKPWDLRANDDLHLMMEQVVNNFTYNNKNFYYARKGGLNKKNTINIRLDEFVQWVYAIKSNDPGYSKNNKKDLFDIVSVEGKYREIEKYLSKMKIEKIERLCHTAAFVKEKVKVSKKEDKGLIRDASIHIISILYKKNKITDAFFSKVFDFTKKYVDKIKVTEPHLTNNKIFTKSDIFWKKLNKIK